MMYDGISEEAYLEAIGRNFVDKYGKTPGRSFGTTGEPWETEFLYRRSGKVVKDRAAAIMKEPPTNDALLYMMLGADNYYAEQVRIFTTYYHTGGGYDYQRALSDVQSGVLALLDHLGETN